MVEGCSKAGRGSSACLQSTNVNEVAFKGGRGGHYGADEVCAATLALSAFKVTVRSTGTARPTLEHVVVDCDTHAATRVAPLEPGVTENPVETFSLRLFFDPPRAGNH